ncbi:MAG TPA: MFS transporter [Acidimicrobiia bacterium]
MGKATTDRPADEAAPETVLADYSGVEEVPAVAWPLLLRDRLRRRVRESDRYRWWVLWSVLAGLFAAGFTITVLAVSIPEIADDFGTDRTTLAWIVTGPFLAHALGMPLLGKVGDVYGHRRVYLVGFGLFAVFTALTALAWSAPSLIVIRIVGALEGAATGPASMALIMHAFPADDRVKAMGWWALVGAGAPVVGLVAGGPIVDAFGWRWLFVAQAPLAVVALLIGVVVLRETPRALRVAIDVRGAVALAVATVLPLLALQVGRDRGWTDPAPLALLLVAALGLGAFVRIERRADAPLLPLEFFRRRNFTASLLAQSLAQFSYMGGFIITPLLMQDRFGYAVAGTALLMLFRPLSFSVSSPVAGYVAVRVGERLASVLGTSLVVVSMACFAVAASQRWVALVAVALVLSGLGMGTSSPSLITSAANAVEPEHLGIANAAQQMVTLIGAVAGMQVLATVQDGGAFSAAYLIGLVVATPAIAAATFVRSAPRPARLAVADAA